MRYTFSTPQCADSPDPEVTLEAEQWFSGQTSVGSQHVIPAPRQALQQDFEGKDRFRDPSHCSACSRPFHEHGALSYRCPLQILCPGDYITREWIELPTSQLGGIEVFMAVNRLLFESSFTPATDLPHATRDAQPIED